MCTDPCDQTVAAHILAAMSLAQQDQRTMDLDTLCTQLGVRRADVRRGLSALYRADMLDLSRMRLTLAGFAIGSAWATRSLRPLRHRVIRRTAAA
jgi:transcription initiation factor IIE alpha subunit